MWFLHCNVARALGIRSCFSVKCDQKTRAEISYSYSTEMKLKKIPPKHQKAIEMYFYIKWSVQTHSSQVGRCSCVSAQPQWQICFAVRAGWSTGSLKFIQIRVQCGHCSITGKAWIQTQSPWALSHADMGDPNPRRWAMPQVPPAHAPAQTCCNTHPWRLAPALCSIIRQSRKPNPQAGRPSNSQLLGNTPEIALVINMVKQLALLKSDDLEGAVWVGCYVPTASDWQFSMKPRNWTCYEKWSRTTTSTFYS